MLALLSRLNPIRAIRRRRELRMIEAWEGAMLAGAMPPAEIPVTNFFAPGIYMREMSAKAGVFVIGHEHTSEFFNILLSGKIRVLIDGVVSDITAPAIVRSGPGVRKAGLVLEDMRWLTIHATTETDVPTLERTLIKKSNTYLEHEAKAALENHTSK